MKIVSKHTLCILALIGSFLLVSCGNRQDTVAVPGADLDTNVDLAQDVNSASAEELITAPTPAPTSKPSFGKLFQDVTASVVFANAGADFECDWDVFEERKAREVFCIPFKISLFEDFPKLVIKADDAENVDRLICIIDVEKLAEEAESEYISPSELIDLRLKKNIEVTSNIRVDFLVTSPSKYYMRGAAEADQSIFDTYKAVITDLTLIPKTRVFFYGCEDWMVSNKALYQEDGCHWNPEGAELILEHTFVDERYLLPNSKVEEAMEKYKQAVFGEEVSTDLAGSEIVVLGDSVFDLTRDSSTGIAAILENYTGAKVYNCTRGGFSSEDVLNFEISHLGSKEPDGCQYPACEEYTRFVSDGEANGHKLIFLLYVGLNDYFQAVSLRGEKSYYSNMAAILEKIKQYRDDARVVIVAPNGIIGGTYGTEILGEGGSPLIDYAETLKEFALDNEIDFVDIYNKYFIDDINMDGKYVGDTVHPNKMARFSIAREIIKVLGQ